MESLALFVANDKFNRKDEGDNYNLRHFNVYINKLVLSSNSIIKFNDKIIGTLEMLFNVHQYDLRVKIATIELHLYIESFYDDFDHDNLKGLLNHLHLDHSEGLVIPKLSHDYQKSIMIVFTKEFPIVDFDSITVYKSEEEMKKTSSSDLYRNDIDLKQKQDFLFSFFQNPSYNFENIFVFRMEECDEYESHYYCFADREEFRKCKLFFQLLEFISPEIREYGGHIYKFVRGLYDLYDEYFIHEYISEEEFIKKFYDWKNNKHWIEKENYINDEHFQYLLNLLLWMDEYLEDERKEVLRI